MAGLKVEGFSLRRTDFVEFYCLILDGVCVEQLFGLVAVPTS